VACRGAGAALLLVVVVSLGGCAIQVQTWTAPNPFPESVPVAPVPSTVPPPTTPSPLSTTSVPAGCTLGPEVEQPAAAQLDPLLLTVPDLPDGYISSGANTATSNLQFRGELAPPVPVAAIFYGEFSGSVEKLIKESLAEDTSASAAATEAHRLLSENVTCGGGTIVDLPGPVPGLMATTSLVPPGTVGIATSIVDASKGSFVVEIGWTSTPFPVAGGGSAALPTPAMMASVTDAALAHLPG
jgi:hypothetical protein